MSTTIRLLGRPALARDLSQVDVRGRKTWALLAVLLARRTSTSRQRLAAMLFDRADDPLGALRWHLTQLRRALSSPSSIEGDPVRLHLAPDTTVDVDVLERGTWADALALPGLGEELLAGYPPGNAVFDAWLAAERARTLTLATGHLTEAALHLLAAGDCQQAAEIAARLVEVQPLDENHHQLLVRALALAGQTQAAHHHVAVATAMLTRELGIPPSPNLAASTALPIGRLAAAPAPSRAGVIAQIDAGHAAVAAGATEAGLDCLRRAVHDAVALRDTPLTIRSLTDLGTALVHGVRGCDTEGAVTLHQAIRIAADADLISATAAAHRELGWIAVQHGRHTQAMTWLDKAGVLADDAEQDKILGVRGLALDDSGHHQAAVELFTRSAQLAAGLGHRRQLAWALSMQARTHLQLHDHDRAAPLVTEALELSHSERWNAFLPYPETQQAHLTLTAGDRDGAAELLHHAFTLACHIGDPCWEALAQHGLARVELHDGDTRAAIVRLHDARLRCQRHPDTYRWVTAHILDTLCAIGVTHNLPTTTWIDQLETLAATAGLRDLVVRAHLHRAALGHPTALAAATLLAHDLDNPTLHKIGSR